MNKIIHISTFSARSDGVLKQLQAEKKASLASWDILLITSNKRYKDIDFVKYYNIGWLPKCIEVYLRYFIVFLHIIWLLRRYRYVILRYTIINPFLLLIAPFTSRVIIFHHVIQEGELGKLGFIDVYLRKKILKKAKVIIGVTEEIVKHEKQLIYSQNPIVKTIVFPNGIDVGSVSLCRDNREKDIFHLCFIASNCDSPWHGFEKLVQFVVNAPCTAVLHVIGKTNLVCHSNHSNKVKLYGELADSKKISDIMSFCDAGLNSFSLEKQGLTVAVSLKVREYLASGLPVISGHIDGGLPKDFNYYTLLNLNDYNAWYDVLTRYKKYTRNEVRIASCQYIEKKKLMESLMNTILPQGM